MNALLPLLRLRTREIVRTWRIWVLPIVLVFFAASGPVITRYTNELLAGALGGEAGALALPDPTAADAAAQWVSDLSQLVVFVVVIMAAGAINGEVRSGVASLLLVKPASRAAYVVSHAVVLVGFVAVAAFVGALVSWGVTGVVFADDVGGFGGAGSGSAGAAAAAGEAGGSLGPLLVATALWVVLATLLIAVSLLASAAFDAMAAAAAVGVGAFFLLAVAGAAPRLAEFTPAGLLPAAVAVASGTPPEGAALWWPVGTGVGASVMLVAVAVGVFRRRELR
ncbi:ABC transporter permease subunit [Leucobacter chromiiresistens]|uniref:ABC-2 type transport system permease protein n=1 Tax=Leucobacter chromiiresistens TaxID=1079994 RepID=A0A1H0Z4X4_9MICO|nr:ABC transporter permease subunit [Leucobacter chromiiresistens]SDQ22438.1 ABC-2 type transport system permease protein [Leucobacter chromiiresistens]